MFEFFAQCTIEFHYFQLLIYVGWFQMPLEGLSFVKMLTTFGIIHATDPLLQNMTKIACLH